MWLVWVQMQDDSTRVACKALHFCMRLCAEAPQLRPSLASAQEFAPGLVKCLLSDNSQVQGAALALAADLTDSQDATRVLEADSAIQDAYILARECIHARVAAGEDASDEVQAIETISTKTVW
jgi:hypothetical protein